MVDKLVNCPKMRTEAGVCLCLLCQPPEAVNIPIAITSETDFLIANLVGSVELVYVFLYYA
jgi:hypothetical protein